MQVELLRSGRIFAASLVLAGCVFSFGDPHHHLWVRNESDRPFVVRVGDPQAAPSSYDIPPRTAGLAYQAPGEPQPGARWTLLTAACQVVAEGAIETSKLGLVIGPEGDTRVVLDADEPPLPTGRGGFVREFTTSDWC